MKKFFKKIFFFIVVCGILYLFYSSLVIVPRNSVSIVYSKINGKFKVLEKKINIVLFKIIPGNAVIKRFPIKTQYKRFIFTKKLVLLDKEVPLLNYKIIFSYKIDINKYKAVFDNYDSISDMNEYIEDSFTFYFHQKVNKAIELSYNLNEYPVNIVKEAEKEFKDRINEKGIILDKLQIINMDVVPDVSYSKIKELINKAMSYEEEFKMKIRRIELEKLKLKQEAENEVEYLKVVGKYIKKNPLILKYLMIKKIDKNDLIFMPTSQIGFDFSDSLKSKFKNKMESEND